MASGAEGARLRELHGVGQHLPVEVREILPALPRPVIADRLTPLDRIVQHRQHPYLQHLRSDRHATDICTSCSSISRRRCIIELTDAVLPPVLIAPALL